MQLHIHVMISHQLCHSNELEIWNHILTHCRHTYRNTCLVHIWHQISQSTTVSPRTMYIICCAVILATNVTHILRVNYWYWGSHKIVPMPVGQNWTLLWLDSGELMIFVQEKNKTKENQNKIMCIYHGIYCTTAWNLQEYIILTSFHILFAGKKSAS